MQIVKSMHKMSIKQVAPAQAVSMLSDEIWMCDVPQLPHGKYCYLDSEAKCDLFITKCLQECVIQNKCM